MKNYLSVIKFPVVTSIPRDAVENTMAWTGPDDATAAINDVNDALHSLYVANNGFGHSVGGYLSSTLSRSIHPTINLYHLTDLTGVTGIGTPVATRVLDAALPAPEVATNLPDEVSVCLSFHGDLAGLVERSGSTRPANRHRGRIFLGPLTTGVMGQDPDNHDVLVHSTPRQAFADAAGRILAGVFGATWCVWSRTNAALYPVVGGFVDNAFDTQRRRGIRATSRQVWPA